MVLYHWKVHWKTSIFHILSKVHFPRLTESYLVRALNKTTHNYGSLNLVIGNSLNELHLFCTPYLLSFDIIFMFPTFKIYLIFNNYSV